MDKFDRIYAFHHLLSDARYPVSREKIEQELECSRATFNRIKGLMIDSLNAPLEYDTKLNGWYYNRKAGEHPFELPGLWFNAGELQALAAISKLLQDLQPGLLEQQLAPLQKRIKILLKAQQLGGGELPERIRILTMGARDGGPAFKKAAEGVLQRKKLRIYYHTRGGDQLSERTVSPQRLARYRDNWYLDAHCHARGELRTFAVDRIKQIHTQTEQAVDIDEAVLNAHYADAYGIFAGQADKTAVLKFSAKAVRWVSEETWHPQQQSRVLENGEYELSLPYKNDQELIMDILRYGPDVKVLAPEALQTAVKARLQQALEKYP